MPYRLRTWGGGFGWGGQDIIVSDREYWWLAAQKRLCLPLGEQIRRRLHNLDVDQFESITHPGADAAMVSHDQAEA